MANDRSIVASASFTFTSFFSRMDPLHGNYMLHSGFGECLPKQGNYGYDKGIGQILNFI
jgi:hypothetical protein